MTKPTKTIAYYVNKIYKVMALEEAKRGDTVKRYAVFPILDEGNYEFWCKQENTHWSFGELKYVLDRPDYVNCSPNERKVLNLILAFFLVGDGAISRNIAYRFLLECLTYEEEQMFISQLHIESVHAAAYGQAALTFLQDPQALYELIQSIENTPCVVNKINFMEKWMLSDRPRYQRLVAFACAEGIFFCTLFAVIFWFRAHNKFENFIHANELISEDESLHRDFGAFLFKREMAKELEPFEVNSPEYQAKYQEIKDNVYLIISNALAIEKDFCNFMLQEPLLDLTADALCQYAELITDNLLCQLGFDTIYDVTNPFTWLNDCSMEQKSNFFEKGVGAYKVTSLNDLLNWRQLTGLTKEEETSYENVYSNPGDIDF